MSSSSPAQVRQCHKAKRPCPHQLHRHLLQKPLGSSAGCWIATRLSAAIADCGAAARNATVAEPAMAMSDVESCMAGVEGLRCSTKEQLGNDVRTG